MTREQQAKAQADAGEAPTILDKIDFDQAAADRAKADGVPLALAGRNSSARAQLSKFVLTKLG